MYRCHFLAVHGTEQITAGHKSVFPRPTPNVRAWGKPRIDPERKTCVVCVSIWHSEDPDNVLRSPNECKQGKQVSSLDRCEYVYSMAVAVHLFLEDQARVDRGGLNLEVGCQEGRPGIYAHLGRP